MLPFSRTIELSSDSQHESPNPPKPTTIHTSLPVSSTLPSSPLRISNRGKRATNEIIELSSDTEDEPLYEPDNAHTTRIYSISDSKYPPPHDGINLPLLQDKNPPLKIYSLTELLPNRMEKGNMSSFLLLQRTKIQHLKSQSLSKQPALDEKSLRIRCVFKPTRTTVICTYKAEEFKFQTMERLNSKL